MNNSRLKGLITQKKSIVKSSMNDETEAITLDLHIHGQGDYHTH